MSTDREHAANALMVLVGLIVLVPVTALYWLIVGPWALLFPLAWGLLVTRLIYEACKGGSDGDK